MAHLAVANILHHKLRSALSAVGIGIGICMLVTLSALARGSLYEISDRWESVDADLIAYPRIWGDNITTLSGVGLPDKEADRIIAGNTDIVERVVPVFLWRMNLAGQDHVVVGTDSDEKVYKTLTGGKGPAAGHWCDKDGLAAAWLVRTMLSPPTGAPDAGDAPLDVVPEGMLAKPVPEPQEALAGFMNGLPEGDGVITEEFLREGLRRRGGFEVVIDSRLAEAGRYRLGQTVPAAGHDWKIVGIIPDGVLARAFIPRRTAQFLFASGNIKASTLMFIKLRGGADALAAAGRLRTFSREVVPVQQYRQMLEHRFGIIFRYVDAVNAVALVMAFLFIMVTLYTMVLQRTRDIAILRSCGASSAFIVRQVLAESGLLTAAGVVVGVALSLAAAWGIQAVKPLLTVTITWQWIAIAVGVAVVGAVASALYPAWRAIRVDVGEALSLE